jgi:hypothetical protein
MPPAFYPRAGRPQGNPAGALERGLAAGLSSLGSWRAVMNGPNLERSTTVANNNPIITLFGNLGGTPDLRKIPAQDVSRHVYDPVSDQVVEKTFHQQAREFRTFSLAVSTKEMEEPRWIRCVDWTNESRLFQKGDRVRLTGSFRLRTYEKDGETKRFRQFVVKTATIERAKIQLDEAA